MSLTVRLDIFSGRENPVWTLTDNQIGQLREMADDARASSGGTAVESLTSLPRLGYRGFTILSDSDAETEDAHILMEGINTPDEDDGLRIAGVPSVEEFLTSTAGDNLDEELRQTVYDAIQDDSIPFLTEDVEVACPPCGGHQAPGYNPGYWNNNPTRLQRNNCYNYANNKATNTFAQPGRGSGQMLTRLTCSNVGAASNRDELRNVPSFSASTTGWYVALVIWPGRDYHWYRQDRSGCWSHKPGRTRATDRDNSGRPIIDPKSCDRGYYTSFCTYMVTRNGVQIR